MITRQEVLFVAMSMKAIYTSSGMQLVPYRPKYMSRILAARSTFMPTTRAGKVVHHMHNVTAFVMKDIHTAEKRLCTYNCGKDWLQTVCPGIEITRMRKNEILKLDSQFAMNLDFIPTEMQASAVSAVVDNGFKNAFFNIPTGEGKTLLSVYLTSLLGVKAWATCYSTVVLRQWAHTLATKTDIDPKMVLIVNSSKQLLKMAVGDWDPHKYDMYLSTPKILSMFAENYGLDLLNDVFNTCGIGIKFYDEAHRNVGNICKINALTNVERTYYLSADFSQAKPDTAQLYYKMFGRIPVIRPAQSYIDSKKYTNCVLVHFNTRPNFSESASVFGHYGFNGYNYMEHILRKPQFYDALRQVMIAIHTWSVQDQKGYRTVLMCNMIEHTNMLKEKIIELVDEIWANDASKPHVAKYHSECSQEEKDDAMEFGDIIVTTHQSMGVGVDLPMLRYIIMLAPVNSIVDNQAAGRARRLKDGADCYYFMFIDDGFAYMTKNLEERLDYLHRQKIKSFVSITYN